MSNSVRRLQQDEEIHVSVHPHRSILLRPAALFITVAGGSVAGLVLWHHAPPDAEIALGAASLLAFGYLLVEFLSWRSCSFIVTSTRVIHRAGLLHRVRREVPIDAVQDVTSYQTLRERLIGRGSLSIVLDDDRVMEVSFLSRPAEVQSLLTDVMLTRHPTAMIPYDDEAEADPADVERLQELARRGVITEIELREHSRRFAED